jgi:NADH-quinone oxidoreductase E subunit
MGTESLEKILDRYQDAGRDQLIPLLQEVQEAEGFLSRESIVSIGTRLNLPASKVYGVATFYNQFRFSALGENHIQVCRGTACHVRGSAAVLDSIEKELKIKPGQNTKDGEFSLEVVACMGACGLAPAMSVNGEYHASVTPDSVKKIVDTYRKESENGNGKSD